MMKRERCGNGWPEEGNVQQRSPRDMGAPKKQDWRQVRRYRAWELKQQGWKQNDLARALGVTEGASVNG